MAVIGIHYGGGNHYDEEDNLIENPVDYKNVYLHFCGGDKEFVFESGNFVKDWFEAKKKFLEFHEEEVSLGSSSSVDHFIMDGAPYDSAYLVFKNDEDDTGELTYEFDDKGWEMFVPKGTKPTWKELKEMCKTKENES
jgi:hypothetical protein